MRRGAWLLSKFSSLLLGPPLASPWPPEKYSEVNWKTYMITIITYTYTIESNKTKKHGYITHNVKAPK